MSLRHRVTTVLAGTALATTSTIAFAPAASAADAAPTGTEPLSTVLLADGDTFDHNKRDYDVATQAVLAVLAAKPDSPVSVLTKGDVALTAFVPTDEAFRILAEDISDVWEHDEEDVFNTVAGLGIDTVESVLLYHVIPGATIDKQAALQANGAQLTTANGMEIGVKAKSNGCWSSVKLVDADTGERNPRVKTFDINDGNVQIAHGIDRVLRPVVI